MQLHSSPDAILRIHDLGKQYANGYWGLRHASASFESGRMVAVLGPNGAGKSTLLHMLAAAIQPTEGQITLPDPRPVVGWSSQRTTIDWYLNVVQNVTMGGRLHGLSRGESKARALALLDRFELAHLATNDVSMLSGGQQQRIQVARTLMANPDIMLLDEPTASLDVESSESVLGFIKERTGSGSLALVSSHDLGLLERYCDEVLFVLDGQIIAHQSMPAFLRRFAPTEAFTLTLDSAITPGVLQALDNCSPIPDSNNPHNLSVSLPDGTTLSDVVSALEGISRVTAASSTAASLRNVYLQMTTLMEETK